MSAVERFVVVLKHPNGDHRIVPVEYVAPNGSYITIRWGQSGLYDLNLLKNVLSPRSAEQQSTSRGKAKWYRKDRPQWQAEDIEKVREMVKERIGAAEKEREARRADERHEASKPAANAKGHWIGCTLHPEHEGDCEVFTEEIGARKCQR